MGKDNERFISTHVPKTGGTSLRNFYERLYGPENTYLHMQDFDTIVRADQEGGIQNPLLRVFKNALLTSEHGRDLYLRFINTSSLASYLKLCVSEEPCQLDDVPEKFSIIHGHFENGKYADVKDVTRVTVLREPLERAVSEYRYTKWMASVGFKTPEWFDPEMDFLDFALHSHIQDRQSRFVGNSLDGYDHVGVTSHLDQYTLLFDPGRTVPLTRSNTGSSRIPHPDISADIEGVFRNVNRLDYELYCIALERVQANQYELLMET